MSFILEGKTPTMSRTAEVREVIAQMSAKGMIAHDISDDEMAKSHARYMVGGPSDVEDERLFRFGTFGWPTSYFT